MKFMLISILTIVALSIGTVDLAAQQSTTPSTTPSSPPEVEVDSTPIGSGGSIFVRKPKVRKSLAKHDLVQVIVVERATANGNSREDSTARASTDLQIASYLKFKNGNLTTGTNPLEIDLEADKRRQIREQNQRSIDIRTRITARIIDVLPNGNVRLEARSERRINEELTVMTLTGEVRGADIDADFSVTSDRLVDQKLILSEANPRTKKTRKNVVERVLEFIWPF